MKQYIYGTSNRIHIINLASTKPLLEVALSNLRKIAADGGRILWVGCKPQAQEKIAESATKCGQYYINHRWPGGLLTNWHQVSKSIQKLEEIEKILALAAQGSSELTKKEIIGLQRQYDKLNSCFRGIRNMGGLPSAIFVIDTLYEHIAIAEAQRLNIPIFAILDTNSSPLGIQFPIPGNDDGAKAINLYCDLVAAAVLEGMHDQLTKSGVDLSALGEHAAELNLDEAQDEDDQTEAVTEHSEDQATSDSAADSTTEGSVQAAGIDKKAKLAPKSPDQAKKIAPQTKPAGTKATDAPKPSVKARRAPKKS